MRYVPAGSLCSASAEQIFPRDSVQRNCFELALYTTRDHDCIMVRVLGPTGYKVVARLIAPERELPSDRHSDRTKRAVVLEAVKVWPGNGGACRKGLVRRPTLTVSVRASGKPGAGRDEETGSQIEQRN